jgi:photosystem II stability/assembly factor-like uncharacterized protein
VSARAIPAFVIAFALSCIAEESAHANGRFPQAQAIVTVPGGDGGTLYLRATFGLLVSRDSGKTWRWVCERALGYEGTWDPPIAATRDGRLWVGLENGLVTTKDGCDVKPMPELSGETIKDLTVDAKGETVWAITGAPGKKSWIWRSSADDRFVRVGGLDDINFMTIEVAPSNPLRVYVTGQPYGTVRGRLFRSDDGGKTLRGDANDLPAEGPFFIAGVDPKDDKRVLLRHLHTTGSDVLVTKDGGKTFASVLSMKSAMFGFAKSDDGKTYWAGSGLADHGIWRSTDRGEKWEKLAAHGVLCLHAAKSGLFVCENPCVLGAPAIAVSKDEGKTVEAIATFADVEGPITCAPACAALWPETRAQVIARPDAGARAPKDAGTDASLVPASDAKRSSCSCDVIGSHDRTDRGRTTTGFSALVALIFARRVRGSKLTQHGVRCTAFERIFSIVRDLVTRSTAR